ncbi:SDR family NAD(P)-dependent oxidoreductase [Kitasatospora sp. MAP5-34]|uniref:SDR family oxidoreductase n=1 Tax=Kitasatospora sp. MAP5-34 TaxID=3035102 RepID=UPI002475670B|nr:SDR family NAD(P)-dependent oxidoreductase [Kitasatospora sp. MAP5-34]MDH6578649.1 NADP-dependent 3-hydroxy acid dehydrogenase YdfG [Kitasatospora sp. MAP5-34]
MSSQSPCGLAVVTGASVGIGRATAQALEKAGYTVISAARRLPTFPSASTGITTHQLDVTDPDSVAELERTVAAHPVPLTLLVNNAGIPTHADTIADSDLADWRATYETNVIGSVRTTQALLPHLVANRGHAVFIGSTVARVAYERGAAYAASKHALTAMVQTLRLELNGEPVRITEIAPGMMRGDEAGGEFMRERFNNDPQAIAAVYQGVEHPLTPEDIAECVRWCATLPPHVDIDLIEVRPLAQAAQHKVHRTS